MDEQYFRLIAVVLSLTRKFVSHRKAPLQELPTSIFNNAIYEIWIMKNSRTCRQDLSRSPRHLKLQINAPVQSQYQGIRQLHRYVWRSQFRTGR